MGINIVGVKEAAIFQALMVLGLLALLFIYIIMGLSNVNTQNFTPFLFSDVNQIFITSGFIFISFGGLLKVATVSE